MWHDSFICNTTHSQLTRTGNGSRSSARPHEFVEYMWISHVIYIVDAANLHVTWLNHMWHDSVIHDMSHSYVTWLIYMKHDSYTCDMTHWYVTWLIHMCHDSFTCDMTLSCVAWLTHVRQERAMVEVAAQHYGLLCHKVMSHMNESCHTWMSHVTHEWVIYACSATLNDSSWHIYEWVISNI